MDEVISRQYGVIGSDGKLRIYNKDVLLDHCSKRPSTNIEILVLERQPLTSDGLRKYWFGVVVKEMRKALYDHGNDWTLEQVDQHFREQGGLVEEVYDPELDKHVKRVMSLSPVKTKVTKQMMWHCIRFTIAYAAEHFNWPIPLPHEDLEDEV